VTVVVGTAGHIDHGKTTLLAALTGIDADRLPEERRRGMTIDVGYAHLRLADGSELDFVDVPGHDKLVGNMLVGAGEIDAAMLVVAADDGPRAQTLEHLELLDALGIDTGLAVVTKIDAVPPERAAVVADELAALIARTRLAGAAVLAVSARTGEGIAQLHEALTRLNDRIAAAGTPSGSVRLAIDRAFTVKGRGTVVTGTLRGGSGVTRGDTLRLLPGRREVRVREVQVHGATVEEATSGRTALNLVAVDVTEVHRGMVVTNDPAVMVSDRVLVALGRSVGLAGPASLPGDRARVRLHIGTAQAGATVGRGGREAADLPAVEVSAVLRLDERIAAASGDRFVLRRSSPVGTVAGGRILDVEPPRGVARRRMNPERLAALAAVSTLGDLDRARLQLHGALAADRVRLADDIAASVAEALLGNVAEAPAGRPLADLRATGATTLRRLVRLDRDDVRRAAADAIDELVDRGALDRAGDIVRVAGQAPVGPSAALVAAMDRLVAFLDVTTPPSLTVAARNAGCSTEGIRDLERDGRIVRLDDDLAYSAPMFDTLGDRASALATEAPLTPARFRDEIGASRKYVMALLEELDRRGVLRRTPDGHVPGPRVATAAATVAPGRRS
jgi:selenocysteine-specific elongation factor